MTNNLCAKCGAELLAGARFCRRCGQASSFDGASVTEAETRVFQETAERRAPETQYYDQRPTGAGYLSPNEMGSFANADAERLEAARRKRTSVIIGSVIVLVAIIALTVLAAIKLTSNPVPTPAETKTTVPAPPTVPQPPQAPQPPQPPTADAGQTTALDYPGATVTMEMTRGGKGSMRQLRTSDSFEQVVAWYKQKLQPSEEIKTPQGPSAVLKGKEATAIITAGDEEGTQILIKKGIDQ
ncbi:MAG: zinc-ribbon domain-containing protein [Acidobacteria bacterium]|nr:zinc-ribbon domain-containing protein [Acidobacteriota bacterium]